MRLDVFSCSAWSRSTWKRVHQRMCLSLQYCCFHSQHNRTGMSPEILQGLQEGNWCNRFSLNTSPCCHSHKTPCNKCSECFRDRNRAKGASMAQVFVPAEEQQSTLPVINSKKRNSSLQLHLFRGWLSNRVFWGGKRGPSESFFLEKICTSSSKHGFVSLNQPTGRLSHLLQIQISCVCMGNFLYLETSILEKHSQNANTLNDYCSIHYSIRYGILTRYLKVWHLKSLKRPKKCDLMSEWVFGTIMERVLKLYNFKALVLNFIGKNNAKGPATWDGWLSLDTNPKNWTWRFLGINNEVIQWLHSARQVQHEMSVRCGRGV